MLLDETYTLDQLRAYIRTKLGGAMWRIEGMTLDKTDVIDQAISDAVMDYSKRCPILGFETFQTFPQKKAYKIKEPGFGVWAVDFVEPTPLVAPFMASLIGVTPLNSLSGGDFEIGRAHV